MFKRVLKSFCCCCFESLQTLELVTSLVFSCEYSCMQNPSRSNYNSLSEGLMQTSVQVSLIAIRLDTGLQPQNIVLLEWQLLQLIHAYTVLNYAMQASTEQLDSSSAPIYPVADIPAQMCPQFSPDPVNLTVQTEEPANLLHSSPTHFVSCFSCNN